MGGEERQLLKTVAWMFMRHGRPGRALRVCEALVEDDPADGASAAALAELLLSSGQAVRAIDTLRAADFPPSLEYAEAVLETRGLKMLGREAEASSRWRRYLESRKGAARKWV